MGIDSFLEIKTWKNYIELIKNYFIIVMNRPGFKLSEAERAVPFEFSSRLFSVEEGEEFDKILSSPPQIFLVHIKALNISSTEIRTMIKNGESIKYLVPEKVEEYIYKNKLYEK